MRSFKLVNVKSFFVVMLMLPMMLLHGCVSR